MKDTTPCPPPLESHRPGALLSRAVWVLVCLSTALGGATRAEPQAGPDRILNELLTVHPYSKPASMTSTADGSYLYAAEGGAIAVIEARTNGVTLVTNYRDPIKRVPVGSLGVLPVEMLLDPAADPVPKLGPNDILYIAGGRDGLWAMQADVTYPQTVNRAVRLDDSGNETDVLTQFNRKWCNDLAFITVDEGGPEETTYLLALFGKKDSSRLRVYELADVRNAVAGALAGMTEFGHEILPARGIKLGRHENPAAGGHSYAFGMAVDEAEDDVYVAMGQHGIARVHLHFPVPGQIGHRLDWGPFFGDGSEYNQDPSLTNDQRMLYGNLPYRAEEGGPVLLDHPPFFLDVAVENRPGNHWLYAAVDHVGMVGFDIGNAVWDDHITGTEFHQEGVLTIGTKGKRFIRLAIDPGNDKIRNFARRLQVVDSTLVVTTLNTPFLIRPETLNDGRSMSYLAGDLGSVPVAGSRPDFPGDGVYTLAYDLDSKASWSSWNINAAGQVAIGRKIHVPLAQQTGALRFFVQDDGDPPTFPVYSDVYSDPDPGHKHHLALVEYATWPPSGTLPAAPDRSTTRERDYRPGRWCYRASLNRANPEVLALTTNDAGLAYDGPLVLDLTDAVSGPHVEANFYKPPGVPGAEEDNKDGSNGTAFEPLGAVAVGNYEYRLGFRRAELSDGTYQPRWRLAKFFKGDNVTDPQMANPPFEEKQIFFTMPPDKFLNTGYYNYAGGTICEAYNQEKQVNYVFANVFGTPNGIWVLDMDKLVAFIDSSSGPYGTIDGYLCKLDIPPWNEAVVGELTTHPEFWNIDDCRFNIPPGDGAEDFLVEQDIQHLVQTYYPHFCPLPSLGYGPPDTWMLAVPCVSVQCDERLPIFTPLGSPSHPEWMPDGAFRSDAGLTKLIVRFFNIEDRNKISKPDPGGLHTGSHELRAFTLIGPQVETGALHVKTVHVVDSASADRYFCFVADLGGRFYVFEITNLLTYQPDHSDPPDPDYRHFGSTISVSTPFATYGPAENLSDYTDSNIFGLEVDEASWTDGGEQRNEVYVYLGVLRVGVEVLRFDVDAPTPETRLTHVDLIQTPGETGFLNISAGADLPDDPNGFINDKLLFVGDANAGFRIYTYGF